MATTVRPTTQRSWRVPVREPVTAPRRGRHIVSHSRRRPRPVWLRLRLEQLPWHMPPAPYTLTALESAEMFDRDAHRDLGISGRAFLDRWQTGFYDDASDLDQHGRAVLRLARSIDYIRPDDLPV